MEVYKSKMLPTLEGDDVLGIEQTSRRKGRQTVVLSSDKDLRTVPGLYVDMKDPELELQQITELEADRWWMTQALTGDRTDGYKGCPGIGLKTAVSLLEDAESLETLWVRVLAAYASKGLTLEDAVQQARVARILRRGDYVAKTERVRLWSPPKKMRV